MSIDELLCTNNGVRQFPFLCGMPDARVFAGGVALRDIPGTTRAIRPLEA
jgi:hypothetical protein